MDSDGDWSSNDSFFEHSHSRPPSIHSGSFTAETQPLPQQTGAAQESTHYQPPCSYYFGIDTLAQQPTSLVNARESSIPSAPVVEDDEDEDDVTGVGFFRTAESAASLSVDEHGMPLLKVEDLGKPGEEVGRGGDRGARVYRVSIDALPHPSTALRELVRRASAHKVYQATVSSDEASFASVAAAAGATRQSTARRNSVNLRDGLHHLVVPAAFVMNAAKERKGLLVPLFDCSLAQFLLHATRADAGDRQAPSCTLPALLPDDEGSCAFLSQQRYAPITSPSVVMAIAFQLLNAVATLNDELPHEARDKKGSLLSCTGYSHNDIYIDNVLLCKGDGRVALCDFELVGHLPRNPPRSDMSRFPPPSRTSPRGFFSRTADTWSLALLLIGLLTGVDPLLSNGPLTDDFGDGPLLLPYDSNLRDPLVPVLDWESNIKAHVNRLLDAIHMPPDTRKALEPLMVICEHCLANNPQLEPVSAKALLQFPMFAKFRDSNGLAESVVKRWAAGDSSNNNNKVSSN